MSRYWVSTRSPCSPDRVELFTAGDHRDRCLTGGESRGEVAADGSCAVHTDLHQSSLRRCVVIS